MGLTETIFTVANGYLGMRGNLEEGRDAHEHGTFINGFHETWPIRHAEQAYGFAEVGQTIVNVPDAKVDAALRRRRAARCSTSPSCGRTSGRSTSATACCAASCCGSRPPASGCGSRSDRMVSFVERHLAVMSFEVTCRERDAPVVISSQILNRQDGEDEYHVADARGAAAFDPRRAERLAERVLQPVELLAATTTAALLSYGSPTRT